MIDILSKVHASAIISEKSDIVASTVENDVFIDDYTRIEHSSIKERVRLERNNQIVYSKIGRYSYTGVNTVIKNAEIGKFTSIAWNVSIGGNTHDMNHLTLHSFIVYPKWNMGGNSNWKSVYDKCNVGNDVWIGAGANILRDVSIGDGAVIGAGSVVTKDVAPYSVVVGNPARIIRMRCPEEWIDSLESTKWWDWPEELIRQNIGLFQGELTYDVIQRVLEINQSIQ